MVSGPRADFLDCPPLDDGLELGSLSADALHGGKASKEALNGFPFNSAAGGQSMLNSYGLGAPDLGSKLRSDVLVGQQGSSEETGLMAPSVELDRLQAPWDGTDHSSPAHHMFNEADPILGPPTLEPGFLEEDDEEAQGPDPGGEEGGTLEECLGLPPPSSSHPSAEDAVEPLSSSYMLFKDIGVSEEPSADHTDLSTSPPPPYVPPPPLSLSDITAPDPHDRLGHSDVTEPLANHDEDEGSRQTGSGVFDFNDKEEVEEMDTDDLDQNLDPTEDQVLGQGESSTDQADDHSLGLLDGPSLVGDPIIAMTPEPDMEAGEEDSMETPPQPSPDLLEPPCSGEDLEHVAQEEHHSLGRLELKTAGDPMEEEEEKQQQQQQEEEEVLDGLGLCHRIEQNGMDGCSQDVPSADLPLMGGMPEGSRAERTPRTSDVPDDDNLDQAVSLPPNSALSPCDHDAEVVTGQPEPHKGELQQNLYAAQSIIHWSTSDSSPTDLSMSAFERNEKAGFQQSQHGVVDHDDMANSRRISEDKPGQLGLDGKISPWREDSKPHLVGRPIKEETKVEAMEEEEEELPLYPHNAPDVKPSNLLGYTVKTEGLVPKTEQFDFSVKPEEMESKSEDLSFSTKPENHLQFTSYGAGIKSEAKPGSVDLVGYPDCNELKPETKTEGLEFDGYPDSSEIKPEPKPEGVGFTAYPDTKVETKREFLEADSTVQTHKLEQGEGLAEAPESLQVKIQMKEERPKTPVSVVESYPPSPRFASSLAMCELPDGLHDAREPTIAQLLQEKALYSFSEWPKDRVIINRLDSICHAVLKGKWPSSSQQYDSPSSLATNPCLANSLAQHHPLRAGYLPTTAACSISAGPTGPHQARLQQPSPGLAFSIPPPLTRLPKYKARGGGCGRGQWRLTSLPLLQERLVAPPYLPELKRAGGRRPYDYEAAILASAGKTSASSSSSLSGAAGSDKPPLVAPPSHRVGGAMLLNGWQEVAIDLTKPSGDVAGGTGASSSSSGGGGGSMGGGEGVMTTMTTTMAGSGHKLPPPITAPLGGMDMAGILQAGLIHPVTGQIVNGNMRGDDSLRRRRGRRRNMEALYSEFAKSRGLQLQEAMGRVEAVSHSSVSSSTSSPSPSPSDRPPGPPTPSSSCSTPTPAPTPPQTDTLASDRQAASKGLLDWLRQNPGYSMDLPAFAHSGLHGLVERPKQRRHRCKDPTKLDVSSLTGEERVPVVHRGTGRRLGGAMAPAIKELSQWLDANSEYYVAPDWADVIKTSGFLPEVKFGRILTEPIHRDPGSRRRGRRPRSEMPKPLLSVSEASGLAPPLFLNGGLMGSMDSMVAMQNLRAGLPGIPISGIMAAGFPHGFAAAVSAAAAAGGGASSSEDGKNGLSMLPMMLHHSMSHPQHAMFSVGALMSPHPSSSSSGTAVVTTTTTVQSASASGDLSPSPSQRSMTPAERDASSPSSRSGGGGGGGGEGKDRRREEKGGGGGGGGGGAGGDGGQRLSGADAVAIITSSSGGHLTSSHLSSGHLTSQGGHLSLQGGHLTSSHMTSQGGHLGFNPFLIPSMSHGLLYPHMFLPHGGVMTLPAMPPTPPNGPSAGSPKRRRKRVREEERLREEEREARGAEERDAMAQAGAEALLQPPSSSSSSSVPSSSSSLSDPPTANQDPITREPQPPNPPPTGVCSEEQREEAGEGGEEVERGVEMRRGEELEGGEEAAGAVVTREEVEKEVCEPDRRMDGEVD